MDIGIAMGALIFPVTKLENDKFQVVVDMALYAKERVKPKLRCIC